MLPYINFCIIAFITFLPFNKSVCNNNYKLLFKIIFCFQPIFYEYLEIVLAIYEFLVLFFQALSFKIINEKGN